MVIFFPSECNQLDVLGQILDLLGQAIYLFLPVSLDFLKFLILLSSQLVDFSLLDGVNFLQLALGFEHCFPDLVFFLTESGGGLLCSVPFGLDLGMEFHRDEAFALVHERL